ncbi:UvrD-helicase domain-containing protein [Pseudozobellia thermophila]|uniref:UvrD-helicase domain-containing protein n=1 Tax=Pseudozobellia thermophila TaxID=192903 RepID=UPI00093331C6|nr:UvrD-helicase domain-containing protein [Pseudozobellia thermophila]
MQEVPFKIYNASAGSGKTHTLTKEYLKIILKQRGGYKRILAITFTNKAVNEMKTRILSSLFEFGKVVDFEQAPALFRAICEELSLGVDDLRERSKETLKDILHNYAFFDISTIDKFTHRVIRTFARDLQIPLNFEVVLDVDLLLDEAVARLLQKAGSDTKLTRVLLDFALEKIDGDKSWDITYDLLNIGGLIFNENHIEHLEKLKDKDIDDFLQLKSVLRKEQKAIEGELVAAAEGALDLIDDHGLEYTDFTRSSFPNFMLKIAKGDFAIDFNAGWKQNFETQALYNKSAPDHIKAVLDRLHPQFVALFSRIKRDFYRLLFLKNAYGNIVPLTVLNAIRHEVKTLQQERDQLIISEFNTLISKEIKDQPAPFIYERLGEKYRHYFIDEFQDTSVLQWNNLVPLIGNALESEDLKGNRGSLFLVGDAKQAIYRWRGGRAEQFLNLVTRADNPFVVSPDTYSLPVNYRSYDQIVTFNNEFFTATSPFLNNELYSNMFVEGNRQGINAKKGGIVQLTFLDTDGTTDKNDDYGNEVLGLIADIRQRKYAYGEICVLVRSNKDGVFLANFLTRNHIPTLSSESLLLNSSDKVRFLVNLLKYAVDGNNKEAAYELLNFLADDETDKHRFIYDNLDRISHLFLSKFDFNLETLKQISVYDGVELAVRQFALVPDSDAYVVYFLDEILEVEKKEGGGIHTFLEYWEKKKNTLSVTAPDTMDAVRIMSIHKSKGLEFPFVIFPFANDNVYKRLAGKKKMWLPLDPKVFNGFDEVLVNEKKEIALYGPEAERRFLEEEHLMELDSFNVLYVALTRAEKGLFVISEKDLTSTGEHKVDHYSGLFIEFLKRKGLWNDDQLTYAFGELAENTSQAAPVHENKVSYGPTHKDRPAFRILTQAGMLWDSERQEALVQGNRMHYILGLIETKDDLEDALDQGVAKGIVARGERNGFEKSLRAILDHPEIGRYYQKGLVVRNERDIITPTGEILRPDRIVLAEGGAVLIDYKTGRPDPRYREQLYRYSDILEGMGYRVVKRILVYINDGVETELV